MIRLYKTYNLIFFTCIFLPSCNNSKTPDISIRWNNIRATGILIPEQLIDEPADSIENYLKVRLVENATDILGRYTSTNNGMLFEPLIPFSRGLSYRILFKGNIIGEIEIPSANPAEAPVVMSVYPAQDTLPENLLKIYVQFSRQMREGESQKHITLISNGKDTLSDVFLDLQPELWNESRTVLTVWLDPGRIKRDLQPNMRLGNPLNQASRYKLEISDQWRDIQELPLQKKYVKEFVVGPRDSTSPDPIEWDLKIPLKNTRQPLIVNFGEALDYFLLSETIKIFNEKGDPVTGKFRISNEEKQYLFVPDKQWLSGKYILQVGTHLEDLAGNNLNRLFDRDIRSNKAPGSEVHLERYFQIK